MYRNLYYDNYKGIMHLYTWDEDGNRIETKEPFKPFYYLDSEIDPKYKSIYGSGLKKVEFNNDFDRRQSIKNANIKKTYGNLPVEQQYLIEKFWKDNRHSDFSKFSLRLFTIDIEVYSPNEFPDAWEAKHPINAITLYDSLNKEFLIWGLKNEWNPNNLKDEYKKDLDNIKENEKITYIKCDSEKELLRDVIKYWINNYPDLVTGWNFNFDMCYIINRIKKHFNDKAVNFLSPVRKVREISRNKKIGTQHSIKIRDYKISGVTILDYQDTYMNFNKKPVPNRKLDTIAEIELGINKVQHESANLADLANENWDLFIYYNLIDVVIINKLEEKTKYLAVARMLAYMGLTSIEKSLDTLPIVNGYCSIVAKDRDTIIPTFDKSELEWRTFEGGFVKDPYMGLHENIVSFDLNSLYPNTMITLNISPETKFGRIEKLSNSKIKLKLNTGKEKIITKEQFDYIVKKYSLALSKANVLFTQNKKGIFPMVVDQVYQSRVDDQKKIKENKVKIENPSVSDEEHERLNLEIKQYDILQYTKKIFINSVYGYSGNGYAHMSDLDIAESVTHTCQQVIKTSEVIVNDLIKNILSENGDEDYIIYQDTDSLYVSLKAIIDKHGVDKFYNKSGMPNEFFLKLVKKLETSLNERIKKWGETEFYSIDSRFKFKMETICDKALFLVKKTYVLHILNEEGVSVTNEEDRWLYKGGRLASASTPKVLKPYIKDIVQKMILTQNKYAVDDLYIKVWEKFKTLDYDDIALIKSVNVYDEYARKCRGWNVADNMPGACKAAYYYNLILDDLGLTHKYNKITNSDKIKYLYINSTNRYNISVIGYIDNYPKEFKDIFEVNLNMMFEKGVKDIVKQFYAGLDWQISSPNKKPKIDIFQEFLK